MKVPHVEGLATHSAPESCGYIRKGVSEALTGECAGRDIEPRKRRLLRSADVVLSGGRQHRCHRYREMVSGSAWSKTPGTHGNSTHGTREIPCLALVDGTRVRAVNPKGVRRR